MTVNSTRDFIPPEPFEGQNYKPPLREAFGLASRGINMTETPHEISSRLSPLRDKIINPATRGLRPRFARN